MTAGISVAARLILPVTAAALGYLLGRAAQPRRPWLRDRALGQWWAPVSGTGRWMDSGAEHRPALLTRHEIDTDYGIAEESATVPDEEKV